MSSYFSPYVAFGIPFSLVCILVVVWRKGWFTAIRRHPFEAALLCALALGATVVGGTKPVFPPDPPPGPWRTNTVLRLYFHADGGRLYPIEAILREVQP